MKSDARMEKLSFGLCFAFLFLNLYLTSYCFGYTEFIKDEVTVYQLIPDEDENYTAAVQLSYDEDFMVSPFTLCLWVHTIYHRASTTIASIVSSNNFFRLSIQEGWIYVSSNQSCPTPFKIELEAHKWQHMCLTVYQTTVRIQMDERDHEVTPSKYCPTGPYDFESAVIYLGSADPSYTLSVADIRIYERDLPAKEVVDLSRCALGTQDYMVSSSKIDYGFVETRSHHRSVLCQEPAAEFLVLFQTFEGSDYFSAKAMCEHMRGRFPNSSDDLHSTTCDIIQSKDKAHSSQTVWLFTENPNENSDCNILKVEDRHMGPIHHTGKYMCSTHLNTIACVLVREKVIYLKGENIIKFKLLPYRGSLIMQADTDDIIKKSKHEGRNQFLWSQYGHQIAHAALPNVTNLLGRRKWHFPSSNDSYSFSLSFCESDQYSCEDGSCIDLDQRCDYLIQCPDYSDESDTCSSLDTLDVPYWKGACPETNPVIKLNLTLISYNQVNLEENTFAVTLAVTTTWQDKRLSFSNIHDNLNSLKQEDINTIWVPEVKFVNAKYTDNLKIQKKEAIDEEYTIHRMENGTKKVFEGHEVMSYSGSHVFLSRKIQYMFVYTCNFDLEAFPFDTQECDMILRLQGPQGCLPQWSLDKNGIQVYGDSKTISVYNIAPLRYRWDGTKVSVVVLISRKYESFLLTTFVPCMVLCLLSQLTLTHFHLEDFQDRITVTLSLLIVLASLFSQMSSTLPSSPKPKCVDFFFFYCILRVSFVFILHSCIEKSFRTQKEEERTFVVPLTMDRPRETSGMTRKTIKKEEASRAWNQHLRTLSKATPIRIKQVGFFVIFLCDVFMISFNVFKIWTDREEKIERYAIANVTGNYE